MDNIERLKIRHQYMNIVAFPHLITRATKDDIPLIVHALDDEDFDVRENAAHAIEHVGLQHLHPEQKVKALLVLGKNDEIIAMGRDAADGLLMMLGNERTVHTDGNKEIGAVAASLLYKINKKYALFVLYSGLRMDHFLVRKQSARLLGKFGDKEATGKLTEALEDKTFIEIGEKSVIIKAFGGIKDREAVPVLIRFAKTNQKYLEEIIDALGEIGDKSAISFLIDILRIDDLNLSAKAGTALSKIELSDQDIVEIVKAICIKQGERNRTPRKALTRLADIRTIPALVRIGMISNEFDIVTSIARIISGLIKKYSTSEVLEKTRKAIVEFVDETWGKENDAAKKKAKKMWRKLNAEVGGSQKRIGGILSDSKPKPPNSTGTVKRRINRRIRI